MLLVRGKHWTQTALLRTPRGARPHLVDLPHQKKGRRSFPSFPGALLVLVNADTDWAENLVCARHLLGIHLELVRVLSVTFRVRRGKAGS